MMSNTGEALPKQSEAIPKDAKQWWFEHDAKEELYWIYSAGSLWRSALILLEKEKGRKHISGIVEPHLIHVAIMLCGYALENLIKGALVCTGKVLDKNGNFCHASHDLQKLFRKLEFELSEKEIQILNIITYYVLWLGRYPIPKKSEDSIDGVLQQCGRKHKKNSAGKWVIDADSEFIIEPDVFGVTRNLLIRLKERIIPGTAFDQFSEENCLE